MRISDFGGGLLEGAEFSARFSWLFPIVKGLKSATTGNQGFTLSDNSTLYLTTVYLADRNKNLFGIPVTPDLTSSNASIIQDALDWIEN